MAISPLPALLVGALVAGAGLVQAQTPASPPAASVQPATPSASAPAADATPGAVADAHPTLPPGDGRATMLRVCSACHAPEIAAQQRMDPQGWKDTVNTMADRGATATDAELTQITAYLAKAFPAPAAGG